MTNWPVAIRNYSLKNLGKPSWVSALSQQLVIVERRFMACYYSRFVRSAYRTTGIRKSGGVPELVGATKLTLAQAKNYLIFLADNQNPGKSHITGIDLDFTAKTNARFGLPSSQLTVTHILREVSQQQKDGQCYSAAGNFADLGMVVFRTRGCLATSLKTDNRSHALGINFKSGYDDRLTSAGVLGAAGNVTGTEKIRLHVD